MRVFTFESSVNAKREPCWAISGQLPIDLCRQNLLPFDLLNAAEAIAGIRPLSTSMMVIRLLGLKESSCSMSAD